ncbi:MAG: sodium:proton antiporter [Polaromonas sp.]|nr:sodium:proton antiporter [Polaromonas sp.]
MALGFFAAALGAAVLLVPGISHAAGFDASSLSQLWGVPLAGILLSIALWPLLAPSFWHHHFGKVSACGTLAFFLPFAAGFGPALNTALLAIGTLRDLGLAAVTFISLRLTPASVHRDNQFSWGPMQAVAKLFAGIFLTIIPVIAMLKAGLDGPFHSVIAAVTRASGQPDPAMYFRASGLLSSVLDNAPTYLVFFNTAGGDAQALMTTFAPTLAAISAGAVFMGANSCIGNARNLMVRAIAEERGVAMPKFFGYMAWSGVVLLPLFMIATLVWFR